MKPGEKRKKAVKVLTRLKTPVVNWTDLERQILEGSIGLRPRVNRDFLR
jgi:hypothetical protein